MIDRFAEYARAGAQDLVFAPACPAADRDRVVETFAAEVLPALRTIDRRAPVAQ